jgi:hypothetical protein
MNCIHGRGSGTRGGHARRGCVVEAAHRSRRVVERARSAARSGWRPFDRGQPLRGMPGRPGRRIRNAVQALRQLAAAGDRLAYLARRQLGKIAAQQPFDVGVRDAIVAVPTACVGEGFRDEGSHRQFAAERATDAGDRRIVDPLPKDRLELPHGSRRTLTRQQGPEVLRHMRHLVHRGAGDAAAELARRKIGGPVADRLRVDVRDVGRRRTDPAIGAGPDTARGIVLHGEPRPARDQGIEGLGRHPPPRRRLRRIGGDAVQIADDVRSRRVTSWSPMITKRLISARPGKTGLGATPGGPNGISNFVPAGSRPAIGSFAA